MRMKTKPIQIPKQMTAGAAGGMGRLEKSAMAGKQKKVKP